MLKKTLTLLSGILLLPFCIGSTWELARTAAYVRYKPDQPYYFTGGVLTYLVVHILFKKPILAYVFGHELTHALFAVLFGGSVKSFYASDRGGKVSLTKSNFIITLAPYFFPLYTLIALALYLSAVAGDLHAAAVILVFLCGATFAFHLLLTALFLQTEQTDIAEYGTAFSLSLVYLFNVVFTAVLLRMLLSENMDFGEFLYHAIINSMRLIMLSIDAAKNLVEYVARL